MLAEVRLVRTRRFLEIDWRDALGALHQVHQAVTLTPHTCKEMFLEWVQLGSRFSGGDQGGRSVEYRPHRYEDLGIAVPAS